ncbi:TIGR02206 family membrane protein [Paenibacillus lycopersici]|uniref:TIGR02206 family membrane protein n=1 Tax=Paenibacillus lycopersici TaxID=2704462 RepID=A0A6C0G3L5_9BACL|nr:TIGR02206 family membrane protein [Paenibacillus lycopersici]QHT62361.1 TIGR02206 family membrane protein [Paenibacillus lycopersici]
MRSFLNPKISQHFSAYSPSHIAALVTLVMSAVLLYRYRHKIRRQPRAVQTIRYALLACLVVPECFLFFWYAAEDLWDPQYTLPLELCSISQLLAIAMLISRSRLLYQIVFLAGIGGAMQAMLTPDLIYPFPHFRFFHFFIVHMAIILAPLYLTWVGGCRLTWKSVGITMIFLNILVVLVGGVDYWLDANYMFLRHKPEAASLLDILGPYPAYLIAEEAIAACIFSLMVLPFVISKRR